MFTPHPNPFEDPSTYQAVAPPRESLPDDLLQPVMPQPKRGELCYAVALWKAWKRSPWRPRNPDAIPPLACGRFVMIWLPSYDLAATIKDASEWNLSAMDSASKPRRRLKTWAVVVELVCGFDETARVVDVATIGGAI